MSIWRNHYCTEMSHFKSREEKNISKENKHNQSKIKRRPTGLGAPLSRNPSHFIFTSVCVFYLFIIYLLIYFCFQSAGRLHVVLVYAEWFPSWLKFRFGHRPYSACRTQRWNKKKKEKKKKTKPKKSSQPLVSVRLPPTSQPLIKIKITNNNNNNNNNNNKIKR